MNREGIKKGDGRHDPISPSSSSSSSDDEATPISPSPDDEAPIQLIQWDDGDFPSEEIFTWREIVRNWPDDISPQTAKFIRRLGSTVGAEFMKSLGVKTTFGDLPPSPPLPRNGWTFPWTTETEGVCDYSSFQHPSPWCPRMVSSKSRQTFEDILKVQEKERPCPLSA
jgi:hypothetical protein